MKSSQKLSQTLAALALMGSASTALADTYTLKINSVEINATKADGKPWDAKIPLKKDSELPDVFIEVFVQGAPKLGTDVAKDTLSVTFSEKNEVVLPVGESITVKVWDKDIKDNDSIAEISFQPSADEIKAGSLSKAQGGVASLKVSLTSNAVTAPAPAEEPAPAPAVEPAPAPAVEPAPAPAEEPAPAPAEEPALEEPAAE